MRQTLLAEKPVTPGNSLRRSAASRSMTPLPQPSRCCRATMHRPMCQYRAMSSRLTASDAFTWAVRMRSFSSVNISE